MFPLLRYFSIASAVALLIAAALFVLGYRESVYEHILDRGTTANVMIAGSLRNALWPEFGPHLTAQYDRNAEYLRDHPLTPRLGGAIYELTEGIMVLKVKIYNAQGITVFSTQSVQIGHLKNLSAGLESALAGETASELARRNELSTFGHIVEDVDVISTYVPVLGQDRQVEAVVEVYSDVTDVMDKFHWDQLVGVAFIAGLFTIIYLALFLIVRHANQVMIDQHRQILANKNELAESNLKLADEVYVRKRAELALRDLNQDLEARVAKRTAELHEAREDLLRKQRLASLGQLIGTVGHDLRNPLGVIGNSLAVIRERSKQAGLDLERQLERSERSLGRCDGIIRDLLDNTRIQDIALKPTTIDAWLLEVLDEQTPPDGIALSCDLTASGIEVPLDVERFRRVVINIFDNACQAMAENPDGGEGRLTVATRVEGGRLAVSFQDTGPGIDPELMAKIFEPLFTTKQQGVGLGLPMVKQIVELHGGVIDITSEKGQGTCVTLRMPTRGAAEAAA